MPKIAIMTDSNCGLLPEEGRRYGISILPMPVLIDGNTYYIWDAGSNWVKTAKNTKEKFYTKTKEGANKVVTHPNSREKAEACEVLRQIYLDIEDRLKEIADENE